MELENTAQGERQFPKMRIAGHLTGFPELIVDVLSPGEQSIRRDRQAKLKLYSVQEVQE